MCVKHGVQDALHEGDLIGGVDRRELGEGVARGVDEGVDALWSCILCFLRIYRGLGYCASDFEVKWGDGAVGGGDVG